MNCPHGMPTSASCVTCMEDGPIAPPARWAKEGEPFRASFPGSCRGCDGSFMAGDRVQRWDKGDEATTYLHIGCRP